MKRKHIIMMLIVLLTIGFAAVTTTLVLNGNILFGTDNDDFDVIFTKAVIDEVEDNTVISQDGKTIDYETNALEVIGDESILEYTVTNNSSMYDAEVVMLCEFEDNEYVRIDNTLQNEVIEAKSEKTGTLTVELIKTSVNETTMEVRCTIDAVAVERESKADEPIIEGESSNYSLYGTLTDDAGAPIANTVVAAFSNPQYTTTDENGYFYIGGLDKGSHTLYVLEDLTIEDVKELSKSEIEEQATTKAIFTTSTVNIVFENGYLLEEEVVEPTRTFNITLEPNGGEIENNTVEVTVGNYYPEIIVPTVSTSQDAGFVFAGWYSNIDQEIEADLNGIATAEQEITLYAKWSCQNGDVCVISGTGSNIGDMLQIGNERFYVTSNDGTDVKMFSEFNLYVGGVYTSDDEGKYAWTPYENPTGIQHSTMKGTEVVEKTRRGTTAFSNDEQKGTNYSDYSGSIAEGYVNNYSNYITDTLEVENSASLISKEELDTLVGFTLSAGNNLSSYTELTWLYSTSYWTSSAYSNSSVWYVSATGLLTGGSTTVTYSSGIRPLVTVSASLI